MEYNGASFCDFIPLVKTNHPQLQTWCYEKGLHYSCLEMKEDLGYYI